MTKPNAQAWAKVATPAVTAADSTQRPRRRWLRFSLRTLLILVTVLCIWLGVKVNQARRQKESTDALRKMGAIVVCAHQGVDFNSGKLVGELNVPGWLRELAGDDFFQTVTTVEFRRPITDDHLVHLAGLPQIEYVNLGRVGRAVTDAGLAHLPRPDRLKKLLASDSQVGNAFAKRLATADGMHSLALSGTRLTDLGLTELRALSKLQSLWIDNTAITDAGLDALKGMPDLRTLCLDATQVTDDGLAKLVGNKALGRVELNHTGITDAGLKHLTELPGLKELYLEGTQVRGPGLAAIVPRLHVLVLKDTPITDASLMYLNGANDLGAINLEGTAITDAGLLQLHHLPKLSAICLEGTKVTKEGMAQLTKALPSLAIVTAPKGP
jgi:hypothetical protein